MNTAKITANGNSQSVSLPPPYCFSETEVGITRVGDMVVLFPKEKAWEIFKNTPPVDDDFGEAILSARNNPPPSAPRELL
jgi:antitoxin VapB